MLKFNILNPAFLTCFYSSAASCGCAFASLVVQYFCLYQTRPNPSLGFRGFFWLQVLRYLRPGEKLCQQQDSLPSRRGWKIHSAIDWLLYRIVGISSRQQGKQVPSRLWIWFPSHAELLRHFRTFSVGWAPRDRTTKTDLCKMCVSHKG